VRASTRGAGRLGLLMATAVGVAACGGTSPMRTPPSSPPAPAVQSASPATTPAVSAAASSSAAAPSSPAGTITCALLGAADFSTVGIDGTGEPADSPDGTGGHACTYAAATAGSVPVELQVFPHVDAAAAGETYRRLAGAIPSAERPQGATFAEASFGVDGDAAILAVREGRLAFAIRTTNDMNTELGLVELAKLVIQRAGIDAVE
jgi:hypothetical protein